MFGPAQGGDAALEAARQRAFGSLGQGSSIFRGSLGQATGQNLERRVSGMDQPYDQATQDRMFSAQADQSAAAAQAQDQRARDFFANSGTAGSGAQLSGLLDTSTRHAQNMQAARADIQNRAQLENFGARERAADASTGFMGAQSAGEAPYRLKEADLLSRYEVTGQDPLGSALAGLVGGGLRARGGAAGPVDMGFRSSGRTPTPAPSMSSTRRTSNPPGYQIDSFPPVPSPAAAFAPQNRAQAPMWPGGQFAGAGPDLGPSLMQSSQAAPVQSNAWPAYPGFNMQPGPMFSPASGFPQVGLTQQQRQDNFGSIYGYPPPPVLPIGMGQIPYGEQFFGGGY